MSTAFDQMVQTVPRPVPAEQGTKARFWRQREPKLDDAHQVVVGGMWGHQQRWWRLKNFIRVLVGGYGSGKTLAICKRMLALALQNAPAPCALVSPTFPMARQTTITTCIELLEGKRMLYGSRRFWWKYNSSTHAFTFRHRGRTATLIIYSGDNPLSLRGPNLGAAGIDEPFIQDEDVFKQMVARVRHPAAKIREINITGTPEQLNWGYDLCVGDLNEQHDVGVVQASTRENLALDPGYVTRLLGAMTGKAADAYVEGKFVSLAEGMVYYAFDAMENVVRLPMPPGAELGAGMDFNVNPMAATVFWRAGSHMHFIDEIELPNADTEYMCSELLDRYPDLRHVYPDATGAARSTNAPGGKSDFTYIKQAGLEINARPSNPLRKDRYNAVNGKFKPAEGKLTLTVAPTCKKLRKYLSVYSHELMRKQERYSHLLDAFSYPISYLFPVDREALRLARLEGV